MARVLATLALLALVIAPQAPAADRMVDITRIGFTPSRITIDPGDRVTWTNKDSSQHGVVADQGRFPASPALQANQSYSYTFTKSGTFGYRDPFNTRERGTIVVREGITLSAIARLVAFGASTTLSGSVSSGVSGEKVTILAQECGKTTASPLSTATTIANGAWSLAVKPTIKTVYTARWKTNTSPTLEVSVAPRLKLARLRARRFSVRLSAAQAFVGKYVVLQRYSTARRRWLTVRNVVLRSQLAAPPNAVTGATFAARLRAGTRLRVIVAAPQVAPCYTAAASNVVRA
ncbi:MAG TPA: cupredoxin domain-containing protein [Gaiellaceae bacterium]|nr:cupredoxin domain-containing protein [Gaiellaceae bacterium]